MTFIHIFLQHGKQKPQSRSDRIWLGIILLLVCIAAVTLLAWLARKAERENRWPRVPCTILSSDVEVADQEVAAPYKLTVSYTFSLGGVLRVGDRYSTNALSSADAAAVYALARSLPEGARTVCWADPADPHAAVLKPTNPRPLEWGTAAAVVASLLLIVFGCVPLFTRPAPPPQPKGESGGERLSIAFLVIASASGFTWMCALPVLRNATAAAVWMRVPAAVEHARLTAEELHGEVPMTFYRTDLLYRYQVAGVEYHSNQYNLTEVNSPFSGGRRRRVTQLAALPKLFCYVDPRHPDQAVLSRAVSATQWMSAWVALAGLLGLWALIPRRLRSGFDAWLRRSRWTIAACLVLLSAVSVVGLIVPP